MNKDGDKSKLDLEPHEVKYHEALQNALVFVRQAAEWGMGITVFRAIFLRLCVHLQQFRTRHVGLNQIHTVFGSLEELVDAGLENVYGVAPTRHQ